MEGANDHHHHMGTENTGHPTGTFTFNTSTNVTSPDYFPPLEIPDKMMGLLSLTCLLVGTPLNIIAVLYFRKQKRSASSAVYIAIAMTDTWISFNGYPYFILMFNKRRPTLFSNYSFMQLWGITWEPFPYFSVYLVLVTSIMRTLKVARPLIVIKRRVAGAVILGYAVFLVTRYLVGFLLFGRYDMDMYDTYPYMRVTSPVYEVIDFYLAVTCIAFPIIPIIISAVICIVTLLRESAGTSCESANKNRFKATVTVLIFTFVYVLCNIPVFLCIGRYAVLTMFHTDLLHGPNLFLVRYFWPMTYISLVQLNSLLNPFVYLCRMENFRLATQGLLSSAAQPNFLSSAVQEAFLRRVKDPGKYTPDRVVVKTVVKAHRDQDKCLAVDVVEIKTFTSSTYKIQRLNTSEASSNI
ncbi:hypothetical protein ACHWQZ_G007866 [Mnemiopsis leidyi]